MAMASCSAGSFMRSVSVAETRNTSVVVLSVRAGMKQAALSSTYQRLPSDRRSVLTCFGA